MAFIREQRLQEGDIYFKKEENETMCQFKTIRYYLNYVMRNNELKRNLVLC